MGERIVHFKIEICATVNPEKVCEDLFHRCEHGLCVLHVRGKAEAPHWHFQGTLKVEDKMFNAYLKRLSEGHSKKAAFPNSRPIKQSKKDINYNGFQYMLKEGLDSVKWQANFSEETLTELAEASEAHVQEMKDGLFHILETEFENGWEATADPSSIYIRASRVTREHYLSIEKMPPPNVHKLVAWHMVRIGKKQCVPDKYMDYFWSKY